MKHFKDRWLMSLVALLVWCSISSASPITPWSYNWSRVADTPDGKLFADGSSTSYLTLTDEPTHGAVGDSDVVATNIRVISDAPASSPATFTNKGYSLTLFLLDENSSAAGTLTFTGAFNGTVSEKSSNITNTFTNDTTQSIVLGGNLYTATIGPYTPPAPPGSSNAGSIAAHVHIDVTPVISDSPEPSSLLLLGLGLPCVGWAVWRRRSLPTLA